jgi:hypothetical protein
MDLGSPTLYDAEGPVGAAGPELADLGTLGGVMASKVGKLIPSPAVSGREAAAAVRAAAGLWNASA